jgi:REP element-mobilizing transposase RayT
MPQGLSYIVSGKPYEVVFRAERGLPFVPWETMKLLVESAIARTQREEKVTICGYFWMGNHVHFLVIVWDADHAARFVMEVKKKVTESIKRLCGFKRLSLWEGSKAVMPILLDREAAMNKIAYQYTNASAADLVDRVEEYPGANTFGVFTRADTLEHEETRLLPWVRERMIPSLGKRARLSRGQDRVLVETLRERAKAERYPLTVSPNAWMQCFGITTDEEARETNAEILRRIREREHEFRESRRKEGRPVKGAHALMQQAISWEHEPEGRGERRVFVISTNKQLRLEFIRRHREITRECRELYRRACSGEQGLRWPPGTFRPRIPPLASAIAT